MASGRRLRHHVGRSARATETVDLSSDHFPFFGGFAMHRISRVCLVVMAMAAIAFAIVQPADAARPAARAPSQQITRLPEDADLATVTVMYHDDWANRPEERALIEQWRALPQWQEMAGKFRWEPYAESSQQYKFRLRQNYPVLPAIVAQDAQGKVFFKDSAPVRDALIRVSTPAAAPERERRTVCPWNHCPPPERTVDVKVITESPAAPPLPPQVGVDNGPGPGAILAVGFGMFILALVIGVVVGFARRVKGVK
jgi:hypothetical protein